MKKILMIIDPQNDFIDGSLAVSGATEAMYSLACYIKQHSKEYDAVVITMDWHPISHCSFVENGGQWPAHCVENTNGASVRPVLLDVIKNAGLKTVTLHKGTNEDKEEYSIFKNDESSNILLELLTDDDVKEIDCCGIALDYCVLNTIQDAIKYGLGNKIKLLKEYTPSIGDPDAVYKKLEDENIPVI